jgi:WD40 repeat protein
MFANVTQGIGVIVHLMLLLCITSSPASADEPQQALPTLNPSSTLAGHVGRVKSLVYSCDGQKLAAGGGEPDNGQLIVWEIGKGQKTIILEKQTHFVSSVAFSPDGQTLAAACGHYDAEKNQNLGQTDIWNIATGKRSAILKQHS